MIERKLTYQIQNYLDTFPAVAILGPRQIGKTTLARFIAPLLKKPFIHLDLERPSDFNILQNNPEVFFAKNKDKCIIIDEVQRLPSLFPLLRPMIDEYRVAGRFLLLGSASPSLLKESSESLAGRIVYTELTSLNLLELPGDTDLYKLWFSGGFPIPFSEKNVSNIKVWQESFMRTYFERDLRLLGLNLSPDLLSRTFSMIAHMQGSPSNLSNLSKSLGIDRRTVERILQFFISSYMIRRLSPFHLNIKKRLVKSPKYYVRDSGMFHHSLYINSLNELLSNPSLGSSWEGFVIEQVISLCSDTMPYFYRTQAGAECDLVLAQGHVAKVCIEAKVSNTPKVTKSLLASIKDLKSKENYIVVPFCKNPYSISENIIVCDLFWLLSKVGEGYGGLY